ncbi:MAG: response regulator [Proteobacteria bacterium]|nr:response regulator [Pseudomonadota bacterium]
MSGAKGSAGSARDLRQTATALPSAALPHSASNDPNEPTEDAQRVPLLIADDDPLIVATMGRVLRSAGYAVLEAFDGAHALELCEQEKPALAIVDHNMPHMSGVDFARRAASRGISVMFLSAHSDEAIVREAIAAGAICFLVKPIDTDQLLPAVRTALQRAGEMQTLKKQAGQLATALQIGRNISTAVGILMEKLQVNQDEALERLRSHARATRRRLEDVAVELLSASDASARILNALKSQGSKGRQDST